MLPVGTGASAGSKIRALLALVLVTAAIFASGCGGTVIDHVKLQDTVQQSLETSLHEKIKTVHCPSDQSVDPGTTFTCKVIFSDNRLETVTLKIRNKDADISIVGLEANK